VVVRAWSERGIILYLPTWLPRNLKPTAVLVVMRENSEVGNLAIFWYSSKERYKIEIAELILEVSPMPDLPFNPEISPVTSLQ